MPTYSLPGRASCSRHFVRLVTYVLCNILGQLWILILYRRKPNFWLWYLFQNEAPEDSRSGLKSMLYLIQSLQLISSLSPGFHRGSWRSGWGPWHSWSERWGSQYGHVIHFLCFYKASNWLFLAYLFKGYAVIKCFRENSGLKSGVWASKTKTNHNIAVFWYVLSAPASLEVFFVL